MLSTIRAVAVAAALLPVAALADQTVVYKGDDGRNLTLEIADSGDVHITGPVQGQTALAQNGEFFLIDTSKAEPRVMRLSDVAAVVGEVGGPLFRSLFSTVTNRDADPETALTIEPAGTATVAGFAGNTYRVKGLSHTAPDMTVEWVASRDPALAPAGKAMQQFMEATMVMAAPMIGDAAAGMIGDMRQTFALGTPLSAGGKFELVSVKDGAIDPARFRLPAEPMAREALKREMTAPPAPTK